jgi:hypothetical protein
VHTDVALAASDLANALVLVGRLDEARSLLLEELATRRESFGPRSLPVADTLEALAKVLLALGMHQSAADHLQEALSIREELLGEKDELTARTRTRLEESRR